LSQLIDAQFDLPFLPTYYFILWNESLKKKKKNTQQNSKDGYHIPVVHHTLYSVPSTKKLMLNL